MRTALFFDTETTGLPLFKEPSEDTRQPHLVQLAACLVDLDKRETISTLDVIIEPDGWTIPDEVAAIHGITTEHAADVGVPEKAALEMLLELWQTRRTIVAHNAQFDGRIIRIGLMRHAPLFVEPWAGRTEQCTQILATPILRLPPTARMKDVGRNHFKSANLGEAYHFFTGKKLEGAHNAMVDVVACQAVYFAIQDLALEAA